MNRRRFAWDDVPRCPRDGALLVGHWRGDDLRECCPRQDCDYARTRALPKVAEQLRITRAGILFGPLREDGS